MRRILGFPVASGGRYDNLLKQFGRPAPATGFAIKTTRILELIGDGKGDKPEQERILIGYDASRTCCSACRSAAAA